MVFPFTEFLDMPFKCTTAISQGTFSLFNFLRSFMFYLHILENQAIFLKASLLNFVLMTFIWVHVEIYSLHEINSRSSHCVILHQHYTWIWSGLGQTYKVL